VPFFLGGQMGPRRTQSRLAYLHTKCHLSPSNPLATTDIDRKLGMCPFRGGEMGHRLTVSPRLRPTSVSSGILIHAAVWPQQIGLWAENWGELCPFGEGVLGPHLTQCGQGRGLSACQVSSWSVQPFGHSARTSQTDRQDRQNSIGRTVLQTVAQK